jgi:hypothetical protein
MPKKWKDLIDSHLFPDAIQIHSYSSSTIFMTKYKLVTQLNLSAILHSNILVTDNILLPVVGQ